MYLHCVLMLAMSFLCPVHLLSSKLPCKLLLYLLCPELPSNPQLDLSWLCPTSTSRWHLILSWFITWSKQTPWSYRSTGRHTEFSCIQYWIPADRPLKHTDPAHRPPKIRAHIFLLIRLWPQHWQAMFPAIQVAVILILRNLPLGLPYNNAIYVPALCPTRSCMQGSWEGDLAKIMHLVRTKLVGFR